MTGRAPRSAGWSGIAGLPSPAELDGFIGEVQDADEGQARPYRAGGPGSVAAMASQLGALSLRRGALVMIALPNSVQLLICVFAVLQAGYVPMLIAPSTPRTRLRHDALRLGAAALIRTRLPSAQFARCRVSRLGDLDLDLLEFTEHPRGYHAPGQVIISTSGTSGLATGCLHNLTALLTNAERHADSIGLAKGDRILVNLPIHFSFALVAQVLAGLAIGAKLILAGPPFSAERYLRTVAAHQVTVSSLTPLLVSAMLKSGSRLPDPLRVLTVGGAALPAQHTADLLHANPDKEIYLTYGLTEAGPRVTTLAAHSHDRRRYESVGRALPGVMLSLRDAGQGDRAQELLVRSNTLCLRRLGTTATAGGDALSGDRALATGDLGYLDDDGYLFLRGRLSDFAIIRGEKVNLAAVRQIAESLDGVVRAVPARAPSGNDAEPLELDLYTDDEDRLGSPELVRRQLAALLTPSERPGAIRIHCAAAQTPYK